MNTPKKLQKKGQRGFTIVELMVATVVFSVVLIVLTAGVIAITRTYSKGIVLNKTQTAARSILDSIAQTIEFNGGTIDWPPGVGGAEALQGRGCVGNQAYDFRLGFQLLDSPSDPDQAAHGVVRTSGVAGCHHEAAPDFGSGTELLSPHMRLASLNVKPVNVNDRLYEVDVTVAYGDYDLLCSPSLNGHAGGCNDTDPSVTLQGNDIQQFVTRPDLTCHSGADTQFCAVSALRTVVQQRLVKN